MMQFVNAWLTEKVGQLWGRAQAGGLTVFSAGAFGYVDGG